MCVCVCGGGGGKFTQVGREGRQNWLISVFNQHTGYLVFSILSFYLYAGGVGRMDGRRYHM